MDYIISIFILYISIVLLLLIGFFISNRGKAKRLDRIDTLLLLGVPALGVLIITL